MEQDFGHVFARFEHIFKAFLEFVSIDNVLHAFFVGFGHNVQLIVEAFQILLLRIFELHPVFCASEQFFWSLSVLKRSELFFNQFLHANVNRFLSLPYAIWVRLEMLQFDIFDRVLSFY